MRYVLHSDAAAPAVWNWSARPHSRCSRCGHPRVSPVSDSVSFLWCVLLCSCDLQLSVLQRHRHDNVVHQVAEPLLVTGGDVARGDARLCRLFELADRDLMALIDECGGAIPEDIAAPIFRQVVEGLMHCHRHGTFHNGETR